MSRSVSPLEPWLQEIFSRPWPIQEASYIHYALCGHLALFDANMAPRDVQHFEMQARWKGRTENGACRTCKRAARRVAAGEQIAIENLNVIEPIVATLSEGCLHVSFTRDGPFSYDPFFGFENNSHIAYLGSFHPLGAVTVPVEGPGPREAIPGSKDTPFVIDDDDDAGAEQITEDDGRFGGERDEGDDGEGEEKGEGEEDGDANTRPTAGPSTTDLHNLNQSRDPPLAYYKIGSGTIGVQNGLTHPVWGLDYLKKKSEERYYCQHRDCPHHNSRYGDLLKHAMNLRGHTLPLPHARSSARVAAMKRDKGLRERNTGLGHTNGRRRTLNDRISLRLAPPSAGPPASSAVANKEPTSNIPVTCDLLKALPAGGQVHIAHDGLESDEDLEVLDAEDDDEEGDRATVPPSAGPAVSNAQLALNTLPAGRHNSGAVAATVPAVAPTWPPGWNPPIDTTITDLAIIHNGRKLPKMDCLEYNNMPPRFTLVHKASGTFPGRKAAQGSNDSATGTNNDEDGDVNMGETEENIQVPVTPLPAPVIDADDEDQGDVPDSPVYDSDDDYVVPSNMTDAEAAILAEQLHEQTRTEMRVAMEDRLRVEAAAAHQRLVENQHNPTAEQAAEWARIDAEELARLRRVIVPGNAEGQWALDGNGNDVIVNAHGRNIACHNCRKARKPCKGVPCQTCQRKDLVCSHYDGPVIGAHQDWKDGGRQGPQPSKGLAKARNPMPPQ
ncbi:unnamed protein product [Aureobasidium pullulans]|nr:unnamed protein product [Aureobasidium pullulans]